MLEKLKQISEVIWELPAESDMKVPARVYSSKDMLKLIDKDKSLGDSLCAIPFLFV